MQLTLRPWRGRAIGADPQSADREFSASPDTRSCAAVENAGMSGGSTTQVGRMPLRARLFLVLAALVVPVEVIVLRGLTPSWQSIWTDDPLARVIIIANVVSCALAAGGGAWMIIRRPSNRCGPVAVLVGAVFATWFCVVLRWASAGGWTQLAPEVIVYLLRLLLFFVVLAFPIGKLDRVSRKVFGTYLVLALAAFLVTVTTPRIDEGWSDQPVVLLHSTTVNQLV